VGALVKRIARRGGWEVSRYRPHQARRVARMQKAEVDTVLDIGANVGQYAMEVRSFGYMGRIMSFEPLLAAYGRLERAAALDPAWDVYRVALGSAAGTARLNVASNLASSSFLAMLDAHRGAVPSVDYVSSELVSVRTLDSFSIRGTCSMKLDVQGYEDRVLAGAVRTMPSVRIIECELSLAELYNGQPSFRTIVDILGDLGFEAVDVEPSFRDPTDGRVLQIDGTFLRVD
jgi:FkbM family methyltransferase